MIDVPRVSGPGSTRKRRSAGDIRTIEDAIIATLAAENPQTVRGLFYRLVSQGVVPKTEEAYKKVVMRLAVDLRLEKRMPFDWLTDATRCRHGSRRFGGLNDWLEVTKSTYRRDLWADQGVVVQVWSEKETLSGVLMEETDPLCVDLYPCRGYPSVTYLASAAAHLTEIGLPAFLYYVGDLDPSGMDIPRNVEKRLREFAPGIDLTFERICITPEQVEEFRLPTRPTKETDSRRASFSGESIEVDSLPSLELRRIVREHIEQHIDRRKLHAIQVVERLERESLAATSFPVFTVPPPAPDAPKIKYWRERDEAWSLWSDRVRGLSEAQAAYWAAIEAVEVRTGKGEDKFGPAEWGQVGELAKEKSA